MAHIFGTYGPSLPGLGRLGFQVARPLYEVLFATSHFVGPQSPYARERRAALQEKIHAGKTVYLLGIVPAGHNAGVALVSASQADGVRLICNEEEERFSGVKYYDGFPERGIDSVRARLADLGLRPQDLHACLSGWNYVDFLANGVRSLLEHAPMSLALAHPDCAHAFNATHAWQAMRAPKRVARQIGVAHPFSIIAMRHHDNHAAFAYASSPFSRSDQQVMVAVLDGYGDDAAISLYVADRRGVTLLRSNKSQSDSLGSLYGIISSTQGGWPVLHSEGRYMGASAWGNSDRLTNPYYRRLRQLIYFGGEGDVYLNRAMANWHIWGELRPYRKLLREVLGPPIPRAEMWNPDAVLNIDDIHHREITQERVDKAAALQLVFEDALFHVIDYLIRRTGSHALVLAGGAALNCVANMRLLEHFDESYYQRYVGKKARLELWVPPTPGDASAAMGAAYNFALGAGVPPGEALCHAFFCGMPPSSTGILQALHDAGEIAHQRLGNVGHAEELARIADFAAYVVSRDGILGFYQGSAETGPRALGHRSIVANPCNPRTLANINEHVKFREPIRPLAPMATLEAAHRFLDLSAGAAADDYNAYNYMILTARARPEALQRIPAVVHRDGTSRVQIVRAETDPFSYSYLKAMGRRAGVEVSVNTSLNVGGPIVQTPDQALQTLKRAKGMSGLILIGDDGEAFLAWHDVVKPPKDGGQRLLAWFAAWQAETVGASPAGRVESLA